MTRTPPSHAESPSPLGRFLIPLTHLGAAAIVFATLVRLLSTHARFPWWDLDPSRQPVLETALLPSQALALDALVWLASSLGVGACALLGRRLHWITGILALIGAAGAALLCTILPARAGSGPDDALLASAWSSAVIGAWAVTHLAADPAIRRNILAAFAGAAWVLAAKGAYQVFIEHAATVALYKANTEAMLAAQGLQPGSVGAREFERRLLQPEATGWVGMSNAHASILAAILAMTTALAWSAWHDVRTKRLPGGAAGVLTLAALASAVGLAMTGSKGGILTGVLATALTLAVAHLHERTPSVSERASEPSPAQPSRRHRLLTTLATTLPLLALLAVYIRGLVAERLSERSLLFRSQYLEGAAGIIADAFPLGVGPGGFKPAYNLHKPPLSPESVESPHSILFDWLACLGAPAIAWCALLFTWLALAALACSKWNAATGQTAPDSARAQAPNPAPRSAKPWLLVPILACAVAWTREAPTVAPDEWLIRLVAVLAWLATILCALKISAHRAVPAALFAAAVALATHAQIELTPVLPATCATVFLLIALAAAPPHAPTEPLARSEPRAQPRGHRPLLRALPLLLLLPFAYCTITLRARVAPWESHLQEAAQAVEPLARIRALLPRISESPEARRELESILLPTSPTDAHLELSLATAGAMARFAERADHHLSAATQARPESLRADDAALRLLLGVAADTQALNHPELAFPLARRAADRIGSMLNRPSAAESSADATIAAACEALNHIDPTPDNRWLNLALEQWNIAAANDPSALQPILHQIDLHEALSHPAQAAAAAKRALDLNEHLRLDPLKQLTSEQRARLESLIRAADTPTSPPG